MDTSNRRGQPFSQMKVYYGPVNWAMPLDVYIVDLHTWYVKIDLLSSGRITEMKTIPNGHSGRNHGSTVIISYSGAADLWTKLMGE